MVSNERSPNSKIVSSDSKPNSKTGLEAGGRMLEEREEVGKKIKS